MYLIEMFGVSLLLTLIIEGVITGLWGLRSSKAIVLVVLINVLTNPLAVLLNWMSRMYLPEIHAIGALGIQMVIECAVIVGEALIYRSFATELPQVRRPFVLSLTANGVSWLCGVILNIRF